MAAFPFAYVTPCHIGHLLNLCFWQTFDFHFLSFPNNFFSLIRAVLLWPEEQRQGIMEVTVLSLLSSLSSFTVPCHPTTARLAWTYSAAIPRTEQGYPAGKNWRLGQFLLWLCGPCLLIDLLICSVDKGNMMRMWMMWWCEWGWWSLAFSTNSRHFAKRFKYILSTKLHKSNM